MQSPSGEVFKIHLGIALTDLARPQTIPALSRRLDYRFPEVSLSPNYAFEGALSCKATVQDQMCEYKTETSGASLGLHM